jgi:hypothetical protein
MKLILNQPFARYGPRIGARLLTIGVASRICKAAILSTFSRSISFHWFRNSSCIYYRASRTLHLGYSCLHSSFTLEDLHLW